MIDKGGAEGVLCKRQLRLEVGKDTGQKISETGGGEGKYEARDK